MPVDQSPTTPRLTRPFAETVRARAAADPEFAQALAEEGEENQCGPDAPVHGAPQTTDEEPLVTVGDLMRWRERKNELDLLLGAAGKEAADLAKKIKAAEFLMAQQDSALKGDGM